MPPTTLIKLATQAAFARRITHPGRCATTAITLGIVKHPLVDVFERVLKAWFQFVQSGFPVYLRAVWRKLLRQIVVQDEDDAHVVEVKWYAVAGPIGTLLLPWHP